MFERKNEQADGWEPLARETTGYPSEPMVATIETADTGDEQGLWSGDRGRLSENSRRALLELIQGPYLSGARKPRLWSSLLTDTDEIRARLHELFLDLVIDPVDEFAFVRPVRTDELTVPIAVRTASLTFMDTLMLLVLRQTLLAAHGERRVIVDRDEVYEQLRAYRGTRDEADYDKRMNASWVKLMNKLGLIHKAGADNRVEISPAVKIIVDADRVAALTAEYRAATASPGRALDDDASDRGESEQSSAAGAKE